MGFVELQSKDHRDLLDIIDNLRSIGISSYVDLPEIIVCGDQSAGKSSVLEAISGMSFPTKDNLCTRFATELVLRRQDTVAVKVSINPGPDRSADEKDRLSSFSAKIDVHSPDIGAVVEKAKDAMGLSDTKVFSTDILRVELCGPTQPHLTMVDLPGLFRAGNRDQSVKDAKIVSKMVRGYVKRPRSIILAVVSAKSDFALQEITELARELDPNGIRTLGLITKPDALDAGSDSEAAYVRLAKNKDVAFRLGWHVLKNRDYNMRDASSSERDEAEDKFFAQGVWTTMDPNHLGVQSLKPRLSNVLKDQILHQLPSLLDDVDSEVEACRTRLERLGTPRSSLLEQRRYLMQVSREFTTLMKAAVDGEYGNKFFGSARSEDGYKKRLRARVQNTLSDFEKDMRLNGQSRRIVDDSKSQGVILSGNSTVQRSEYLGEVIDLMKRSRARELPGTFNPLVISELFAAQCQPWQTIAKDVEEEILGIVYEVAQSVVDHVAVDETSSGIFYLISKGIDGLKCDLGDKCKELLKPHMEGHPITYNHYLTDTVQKRQAERRRRTLEKQFKELVGPYNFETGTQVCISPLSFFQSLETHTEVDMERFGGELAIDYMLAYYQVALKKFTDDVAVLAVEQCLISHLPDLFHSEIILDLKDDEVSQLVRESEAASTERVRCREKLMVLEAGKSELRRLDTHRSLNLVTQSPQSDSRSETASHRAGSRPSSGGSLSPARSSRASSRLAEPEPTGAVEDGKNDELVVANTLICAVPEVTSPGPVTVPAEEDIWGIGGVKSKKHKKKKTKASIWDDNVE